MLVVVVVGQESRLYDQGDGRIDGQGGQAGGQGSEVNDGVNGVPDFSTIIAQQLQNLLPTIVAQVGDQGRGQGNACNPKEYDGKGGAIVYTRWIEKMESVQDMSVCRDSQKVKYTAGSFVDAQKLEYLKLWNHAMVGVGHAVYTDRFHELARLVPHLLTPEAGTLTDEALKNGSIKNNPEKRGNGGEPSKDRNVRDYNKRTRTGNAFATTAIPIRGGYTGTAPKCTTCSYHHSPETPCRSCFNYNRLGYFAKDCRVAPRNVNPINARNPVARTCFEYGSTDHIKSACPRLNQAQRLGGNHQNQVVTVNGGQGRGNQGNQARGRAFMLGAEEARQDPNIMTGMDWLSDHKAEIICHEKVVRIPLLDEKVLMVLGEKPEEKIRQLMSAKANEKKQEEIVVVKDFPKVFPDDLSRLPPV
ncbi:hypothetical protein Tco_1218230 [Tanacetum coccineum]